MMHESHPLIARRLKRAHGHLRSIIDMIEQERSCLDLAQQLHAVENAVANAKRELIHDHIEHCIDDGAKNQKSAMRELKALTKYL
jgi:DNA-binding FrmR family transcriptional regulator